MYLVRVPLKVSDLDHFMQTFIPLFQGRSFKLVEDDAAKHGRRTDAKGWVYYKLNSEPSAQII